MAVSPQWSPKWWHNAVVYQIYPRSWSDADADGIGDFDGITSRLDHFTETLPIDAVWVAPLYPSPHADFGYDVSDYCAVDPMYGDLDAFDRFLGAAHARNLKVIVDWVPNHTSDAHPWFVESRRSKSSAKRDWYIWRDGDGSTPPNNWVSVFGGPAWTFDEDSGQWYLHSFLSRQPDLNWRNPDVEEAMLDTLRFWLERGVDGFRIDVAQRCMKDPALRDNPPAAGGVEGAYKPDPAYVAFDHIYDKAHPDIHRLFKRIRRTVDEYEEIRPRFVVGEIHEYDWNVWASYYGWELDELHMPFNFAMLPTGMDPEGIRRAVEGLEAALPTGAWPNWVLGNHDEPRIATRYGWEQSKAAAVLLLTLRGTPTIYYGDEIGMLQVPIPDEAQQDPWGVQRPGFGRDGCRTPMQWSAGPAAGFSGGEPWLPVHEHHRINVADELGDPASHLSIHQRVLQARRASPALRLGAIAFLSGWQEPNPLVYERTHETERVIVAMNLSDTAATASIGCEGEIIAGTDPGRWDTSIGPDVELEAWEAVVIR
jgi:alpha-glucosidase